MSKYENLIFNNVEESLDKIPLHFTQNNIQRLATQNLPIHTIQLGDEHYSVTGHRTIWIPAGLIHAANVKKGSGYYICVILESTKNIFWSE